MEYPPLSPGVAYRLDGEVAVITLDNPPVNSLAHRVRQGLVAAFDAAHRDPRVRAIVLAGAGRGFSAGGDIKEFGTQLATAAPALSLHVHPVIEGSEKPVVAAIHGLAVGGGLETAMVCHYRVAAGDAKVGLPELKRGVIPLSGTQRLPRALGVTKAIDLILGGELVPARTLIDGVLFDRIVEGDAAQVLAEALLLARARMEVRPLPLIRHRAMNETDAAAKLARARARVPADDDVAREALRAIEAAVAHADFDAGMAVARVIYDGLVNSDEVRRQRDRFFAERAPQGR